MTDFEMVKRCAEKMGIHVVPAHECWTQLVDGSYKKYDPLTDDAQAMALVKKFDLALYKTRNGFWIATHPELLIGTSTNDDLNRAIVECVARMP